MVSSPKRKRTSMVISSNTGGGVYEVEEVIGYKLVASELKFFIKWKGYDNSYNTWEPLDNLVQCTVFREYVDEKFKSLEKDIYVNCSNIKQRVKKDVRQTMKQQKAITMYQIQPFDPFEYKVIQVFYHLLPADEKFKKKLENLVYKNHFFKLDEHQGKLHDELLARIRKKEDIVVTIENDEDFSDPPKFEYLIKNFLNDDQYLVATSSVKGCKCKDCSKDSECCPKLKGQPFPYRKEKNGRVVMRLNTADKIIECGDLCECGEECMNRISQRRKEIPLCLFKTKNRGWGVRALANIPKGTFILEYVGELIGQDASNERPETAYLFDLNPDRLPKGFYTIDAFTYGNLSRFVNHSCDPNAKIWFINNCHGDPKNQKLW